MTNAKLLTFNWKQQTVSGKRGEIMVTWSLLPFAVNAMLNLSFISLITRETVATESSYNSVVCSSISGWILTKLVRLSKGNKLKFYS